MYRYAAAEAHAQALFLAALLLEDLPRSAVTAAAAEALMSSLVRPGVKHASAAVRKEAIKCLGLLGITTGMGIAGTTSAGLYTLNAADPQHLKAHGLKPRAYEVKIWLQNLVSNGST